MKSYKESLDELYGESKMEISPVTGVTFRWIRKKTIISLSKLEAGGVLLLNFEKPEDK